MKKFLSIVLAGLMLVTFTVPALAAATRDDFKAVYADYTTYYDGTYVSAYQSYNQVLVDLKTEIQNANITTNAQAQRILTFLTQLKTAKSNFFGTRATPDKSRGKVPTLRALVSDAFTANDYDSAIDLCGQLKTAVVERVGFLNGLKQQIQDFDLLEGGSEDPQPTTPNAGAEFEITAVNSSSYYAFEIRLTNNSDTALTDWNLRFDYNGSIDTMWVEDSSVKFQKSGNTFEVTPFNQWQTVYTIPAHTTVVINGNGQTPGTGVSNASISGNAFTMTFKPLS